MRLALAALSFPASPADSVRSACESLAQAAAAGADLVCFPECFVPGYRALGAPVPPADPDWLDDAHAEVARAAGLAGVAVVLGTERFSARGALRITALVIGEDGKRLGWQDKVQLDASEEDLYEPGEGREVFDVAGVRCGVVICHEGWRYPETVRAAVRAGAQLVLHPHFSPAEPGLTPSVFADPGASFHEAAARCRAAENTVWFASVNCADADAATTSAVVDPEGDVVAVQPRGEAGLLLVDLDPALGNGRLASRLRGSAATSA